jgi:hypothetical protein
MTIFSENDSTFALLPRFEVSLGQNKGHDVQKFITMSCEMHQVKLRGLKGFVDKWKSSFTFSRILTTTVDTKDEIQMVFTRNSEQLLEWLNTKDAAVRQSANELIDVVRRSFPGMILRALVSYLPNHPPVLTECLRLLLDELISQN